MAESRVKICGLTRRQDAEIAVGAGAAYLGAVLASASPRRVTPEQAAALARGLDAALVCVFVNAAVREAAAAAAAAGAAVVQLHGEEPPETVAAVRASGPWRVWKALRLRDAAEFESGVERYSLIADGILIEGRDPRAHGGTGARFAWERVAAVRVGVPPGVELIVAGGLTPDNVAEAIERLRPDVVDVSSGVEAAPGRKDAALVRRFLDAARAAGARAL